MDAMINLVFLLLLPLFLGTLECLDFEDEVITIFPGATEDLSAEANYKYAFDLTIDYLEPDFLYFSDFAGSKVYRLLKRKQAVVIAGSGTPGFKDDYALSAQFHSPAGLILSPLGKKLSTLEACIFVCDFGAHTIRKIDLVNNYVSTFAGVAGVAGFKDGFKGFGLLNGPIDIELSPWDEYLYVSDSMNHAIRKISDNGALYTIVGNGSAGWNSESGLGSSILLNTPLGLKVNPRDGKEIIFTDSQNHAVRSVKLDDLQVNTIIRNATALLSPNDVSIDMVNAEIIYIVDTLDNSIKKVDRYRSSCEILIGNGGAGYGDFKEIPFQDAQFSQPKMMVYDRLSEMFLLTDSGNMAIRSISIARGKVHTILRKEGTGNEDGSFGTARFFSPSKLHWSPYDERKLYVSDTKNHAIRVLDLNIKQVSTLVGKNHQCGFVNGNANEVLLCEPRDLLYVPAASGGVESAHLITLDYGNNYARKIPLNPTEISSFLVPMKIASPSAIAQDASGKVYISASDGGQIIRVEANQTYNTIFTSSVSLSRCKDGPLNIASFSFVESMVIDPNGVLYLSDTLCNTIRKMTSNQISTLAGSSQNASCIDGTGPSAFFNNPAGLTASETFNSNASNSLMYLADKISNAIRTVSASGTVKTIIGGKTCGYSNNNALDSLLCLPSDVAVNFRSGILYFLDQGNSAIRSMNLNGDPQVETLSGFGAPIYTDTNDSLEGTFKDINSILIAGDRMLVLDSKASCIFELSVYDEGNVKAVAGSGSFGKVDLIGTNAMFNRPEDFVFGPGAETVFVADTENHVIRKVTLDQYEVTTVAGDGTMGNVISTNNYILESSFNRPQGLAYDFHKDILYISDTGNHCIKKIEEVSQTSGQILSVVAGSNNGDSGLRDGSSDDVRFSSPSGLCLMNDYLFVADTNNHAIRQVDLGSKQVTTVVGYSGEGFLDGDFEDAKLSYPMRLTGRNGDLYVTDFGNDAVRVVNLILSVVETLKERPSLPKAIYFNDENNLFVGNTGTNSIQMFVSKQASSKTSKTTFTQTAGSSIFKDPIIIVSISGIATLVLVAIIAIIIHRKTQYKILESQKLVHPRRQTSVRKTSIAVETINLDHGRVKDAIEMFELSMKRTIKFPESQILLNRGASFIIIKAKLMDSDLITKFEVIDVALKMINGADESEVVGGLFESFMYEVVLLANLPKCSTLSQFIGFSAPPDLSIVTKDYPFALRDLLMDRGFYSNFDTLVKIATDVAQGIDALHKAGIIHFDIKPSILMIEYERSLPKCVICDFSYASFVSDIGDKISRGVKRPTALGISARYAAPELFQKTRNPPILSKLHYKNHEIDKKVDIFAYGVTMYYVFTRNVPWIEKSTSEIEAIVTKGGRPQFTGSVDGRISSMIEKCWANDANERPVASQLLETLQSIKKFT